MIGVFGDGNVIKGVVVAQKIAAEASNAGGSVLGIILTADGRYLTPHAEINGTGEFEINPLKGVAGFHLIRELDKVAWIVDSVGVANGAAAATESAVGPHRRGHGEEHGRHCDECSIECLLVSH